MTGRLCVCVPKLWTRRKPGLAGFTRSKNGPHGALREIAAEALQYKTMDVTDLSCNVMRAAVLGV